MIIGNRISSFIKLCWFSFRYDGGFLFLKHFWVDSISSFCTFYFFVSFVIFKYLPYVVLSNWIYAVPDIWSVFTIKLYYVYLMPFLILLKIPELIHLIKTSYANVIWGNIVQLIFYFFSFLFKFIWICISIIKGIISFIIEISIQMFEKIWDIYSLIDTFYFYANFGYDIYNDLCYYFIPNFIISSFYCTLHLVGYDLYDFEKFLLNHMLIYSFHIRDCYMTIYMMR
jgi:hypothetical protein